MKRLITTVAACFCVAYVVVAQRVGEQYPLSPLTMWDSDLREGGRVVARSARGLEEVTDFTAWDCPAPLDFSFERTDPPCAGRGTHVEFDRVAEHYIRSHAASLPAAEEVSVVRRVFTQEQRGRPLIESTCELARCRAARRDQHGR